MSQEADTAPEIEARHLYTRLGWSCRSFFVEASSWFDWVIDDVQMYLRSLPDELMNDPRWQTHVKPGFLNEPVAVKCNRLDTKTRTRL